MDNEQLKRQIESTKDEILRIRAQDAAASKLVDEGFHSEAGAAEIAAYAAKEGISFRAAMSDLWPTGKSASPETSGEDAHRKVRKLMKERGISDYREGYRLAKQESFEAHSTDSDIAGI